QSNSKPVRPRATSVPSLRIRTLDAEMEHSSSPVYGHQRFVLDHLHNTNLGFDNPMVPSLSSSSNESSNGFVSHGAGGSDHTLLAQQHHIENQVLKQQVQSVADYCRRVQIKNNQLEHKVKNLVKERDHHKAQSHHWNAVNPAIGKSKAQLFMENGQLMMETIRRMGMEANVKDEQLKSKTEQSKRWEQKAKFLLDLMQKNVPKRQTTAEVLEAHLGRSSNHMENSSISTYQQPGDTVVSRTNLPLANSASTNLLAVNATPFSSERQLQTHASTTHLRSPGKQDQVLPEVSTPISHGPIIHEIPSSPEANPAPVDLSKKPLLWLTQNGGTHPCSPNFGYGHSQVSKNNTASKRARFDPNSSPLDCEAPAPTKKGRELQQRRLQSWEKKKAIHLEREARKKDREVKKAQKDEARKAQKAKNFKPKDVSANTPNQESYTNEGSNDDDFTMHFDAAVAEMEAEEDHGNEEDNRENDMTIEQDLNEHLTKQLAEMDAENHSKATSVEHGAHENHYPGYDMSLPAIDNAFNAALQGRSAAATLATESENTPQLTNAESPEDNDLDSLFEGSDAPNDEEPVSNNQAVVSSNSQDAAVTYPTTGIANQFGATESENTPQLTNAESPEDNDLDSLFEGSDAPNDEEPVSNSQAVVSSNSQDAAVTYPTTGIADQFGATMIDNGFEASDCELFDFDKFLADADESGINFPMFDEI
ncbi:hypothetical protein MMC20_001281, partial [Loxospora ochrophaea]|nr:hypothetical protein [Loxospora ochrophaea]